jgi:hypothetical protein
VRRPSDPPAGLIPLIVKGCTLLLTPSEYAAAIRRGKVWRRQEAVRRRETVSR